MPNTNLILKLIYNPIYKPKLIRKSIFNPILITTALFKFISKPKSILKYANKYHNPYQNLNTYQTQTYYRYIHTQPNNPILSQLHIISKRMSKNKQYSIQYSIPKLILKIKTHTQINTLTQNRTRKHIYKPIPINILFTNKFRKFKNYNEKRHKII